MTRYDLAIIGSGPGGYVAALYASRHGMRSCLIEKDVLGGTCLNRGCIPTKCLLQAASVIRTIASADAYGIDAGTAQPDYGRILTRTQEVILRLRTGIETLLRAARVDLIRAEARLLPDGAIGLSDGRTIEAGNIIIAAGSRPRAIPEAPLDGTTVFSSDDILTQGSLPATLAVIGGGSIGCEYADAFNAFGARVTLIEAEERLVGSFSRQASRRLAQVFAKKGITCHTGRSIESLGVEGAKARIRLTDGTSCEAERVLVAVGRVPATEGLGLDARGIRTANGRIVVDESLRTASPGVYAIGDCVVGPQFAHKASADGILACDIIRGVSRTADYSAIPACVWTDPQIASVGLSEEDARSRLGEIHSASFPFLASGKAYLRGRSEGYVKIIGEPDGGKVLGVEIVGDEACELIAEAVLAVRMGMTVASWAESVHAHPTLSEALWEAARVYCRTGIHTV